VLSVCDAGQVVIAQAASAGTSTTTPWITVAGLTQSVSDSVRDTRHLQAGTGTTGVGTFRKWRGGTKSYEPYTVL